MGRIFHLAAPEQCARGRNINEYEKTRAHLETYAHLNTRELISEEAK